MIVNFNGQRSKLKNKSVIIGSYYRPPNSILDALNNLKSSIANVNEHSKDKPIILAGDFNLPHIDWENNTVKTGSNNDHIMVRYTWDCVAGFY
jgi:hypothetical protein